MAANFPHIIYIYDRYKKASASKQAVVELRISYNRKQKYISTGVFLFPKQWKNGIVINSPDAMQINIMLDKMLKDVREIIMDMDKENNIDIFSIPKRLEAKRKKMTFIDFCEQRATIRKYGKRKDTQERYDRFIRFFKEYGKINKAEDVTDKNIIGYDRFLSKKGLKDCSKWHNYHRFLNSFIIDAIDDGLLHRNPYRWLNINKGDSSNGLEKYLTIEEFDKIKNFRTDNRRLEKIRDLFIFQTYTCLSYSDLRDFDVNNIKDIKGTKVYVGDRKKTGKDFTIPLLKPALYILDKYNGRLPLLSNPRYNSYLKELAQKVGISKPVSTHWARHTGATMLLNKGVDMRIVSKICGHASTKITEQVYAKLLDETVVDAIMPFNP